MESKTADTLREGETCRPVSQVAPNNGAMVTKCKARGRGGFRPELAEERNVYARRGRLWESDTPGPGYGSDQFDALAINFERR